MTGKRIAVGIAAAAVVLVAVVALAAHQRGARVDTAALTPPSTTGTVTSVVKGMDDQLAPLPDGATPALTTDQVIALLKKNPGDAAYASDPISRSSPARTRTPTCTMRRAVATTGVMVYVDARRDSTMLAIQWGLCNGAHRHRRPEGHNLHRHDHRRRNTGSPLLLSEDQNP